MSKILKKYDSSFRLYQVFLEKIGEFTTIFTIF